MIANFNHNHQKIFGASWKAVILAFPVVWGKKVGRGGTTERRTYPCTQVRREGQFGREGFVSGNSEHRFHHDFTQTLKDRLRSTLVTIPLKTR
jgi:hypothetical protein